MRRIVERLRRLLKPPRRLKMTRLGRTFIVLTLGIGLGALNTGNNLLYLVLGFLLSLIVVSGVLSENALWDVHVRRLMPDGVFALEPFPLRYELTRKRGRTFALKLTEEGGLVEATAWVPTLEASHAVTVRAEAVASRRGPCRLLKLEVSTTFPLGLFQKSRTVELEDVLLVYPRRGFACEPPTDDQGRQAGDAGSPYKRDGTGDLLGLRELQPLEDSRRVHWKKSATVGKLLKVEREREERRQYFVRVDPTQQLEALDRACEEAAALTQLLIGRGHEVGLESGKRRLRPGAGPAQEKRVLGALAWAGFDEGPDA